MLKEGNEEAERSKKNDEEAAGSEKNDEEAPAQTRTQLIKRLLKRYIVGQEDEEGIQFEMATTPVNQDRLNRSILQAPVEGMLQ